MGSCIQGIVCRISSGYTKMEPLGNQRSANPRKIQFREPVETPKLILPEILLKPSKHKRFRSVQP
jgi:hypothetical protein